MENTGKLPEATNDAIVAAVVEKLKGIPLVGRQTEGELYEIIMNSVPIAVYVTDMDERVILYNKATVDLFGPQKLYEKLVGEVEDYGLFLPDRKTPWAREQLPMARVRASGNPSRGIMFVRNAHKPTGVWIVNDAYPLRGPDGMMIGAIGVMKEIVNIADQRFSEPI